MTKRSRSDDAAGRIRSAAPPTPPAGRFWPRPFRGERRASIWESEEDRAERLRQRNSVIGFAVAAALLLTSLALYHSLSLHAAVEDCLMAGGKNCDALLARKSSP
jgi:hypothetical protein